MFYLINTFNAVGDSAGHVLSGHRTLEAVALASVRLGKALKNHHGQGAYLPTIVIESSRRLGFGQSVNLSDQSVREITEEESDIILDAESELWR